ncbi:MAG: biotin/lipoyl-binding protein [Gemmataceae bacterium]
MTWLRRLRPAMIVLMIVLTAGMLVGAGALTAGHGNTNDNTKLANTAPATNGAKVGGPITMGTVDSDPGPVSYGLPTVLQSGSIAEVFVKDGQEVKAGDKLYAFDTSIQKRDMERAEAAVKVQQRKVDEAKEGAKQHAKKIEVLTKGVEASAAKVEWQGHLVKLIEENLEQAYIAEKMSPEEIKKKKARNADLYKAQVDKVTAENELGVRTAELNAHKAADPQVLVHEAEAGVAQAQSEVEESEDRHRTVHREGQDRRHHRTNSHQPRRHAWYQHPRSCPLAHPRRPTCRACRSRS